MALLRSVMTTSGIHIDNAYARIDAINGYKENMTVYLNYYLDQQAFAQDKAYLVQESYSFVPSVEDGSPNFIKQGYEYLKSLPEFSNAIDVLE